MPASGTPAAATAVAGGRDRLPGWTEPPPKKVPTQGGHLKKVPTQGGRLPGSEGTHTRPEEVPTPGRERYPHPNQAETPPPGALASAHAVEGAPPAGPPSGRAAAREPSALEPSALSRAASDPRLILGELTRGDRRLTELIISWFGDEGVRGEALATRLLHLVGEGKGDSLVRWARRALAEQDPDYARTTGSAPRPAVRGLRQALQPGAARRRRLLPKAMAGDSRVHPRGRRAGRRAADEEFPF